MNALLFQFREVHRLTLKMRPSDVVLVLLLLCLFSPAIFALSEHSETTLTLQVEPKSVECFYEDVESLEDVTVYYQVLRGGLLDIKVIVCTPF